LTPLEINGARSCAISNGASPPSSQNVDKNLESHKIGLT
jgi:hypothetical protein